MWKSYLALSLCLVICSSGVASEQKLGRTLKEAILRSDSTVFSGQIGALPAQTKVVILKERYDWYKVQLPANTYGFVHSSYIQTTDHRSGYSKANSLNIRTGPSLDDPIIGSLGLQDEVAILAKDKEWYKIKAYPYCSAWVNQKSIEIIEEKPGEALPEALTEAAPEEASEEAVKEIAREPDTAAEIPRQAPIEKIAKIFHQKIPPVASGILKPSGKFFSFINYKLENENGIISLKIPLTLWPHRLLYKRVDIWGSFDETRNYLVVERIEESAENPDIKKVKDELRQIKHTLEAAVDIPEKPPEEN